MITGGLRVDAIGRLSTLSGPSAAAPSVRFSPLAGCTAPPASGSKPGRAAQGGILAHGLRADPAADHRPDVRMGREAPATVVRRGGLMQRPHEDRTGWRVILGTSVLPRLLPGPGLLCGTRAPLSCRARQIADSRRPLIDCRIQVRIVSVANIWNHFSPIYRQLAWALQPQLAPFRACKRHY
jgi:hypothetical protein